MRRKLTLLLPTLLRLGPSNITTVALYRMAVRSRLAEQWMVPGTGYEGPFFSGVSACQTKLPTTCSTAATVRSAEELLEGYLTYFSREKFHTGSPPDWFLNPFEGGKISVFSRHWSRIDDFTSGIGDIKTVWEASRFDWSILLARACRLTGEARYLNTLNDWMSDWTRQNPLNLGPHWKCGQETGIRLQQVLLTAFLLGQHKTPLSPLIRFVTEHCRRIEPTIRYAMAQDNNHGTSEAAALFVAGAWLASVGESPDIRHQGDIWRTTGRRWLENRLARLVADDGSFSQYSLNYHRVLVDTLNLVEFWRSELLQDKFSKEFYRKAKAAVEWLYQMTDTVSGDAPNLGANDGARLFVLSSTEYRDYRPSVQLGTVLFLGEKAYPAGTWDESLFWLGLSAKLGNKQDFNRQSKLFPEGGYALIRSTETAGQQPWGIVRSPNFRFRPGHADALHFDLWHEGVNILRDSGSYSYNAGKPWRSYFGSTRAHNTVQFDERDQMPRLGRFLQGAWLRMSHASEVVREKGRLSWSGAYTDYMGCRHQRTIISDGRRWRITDEIAGFKSNAVIRWRLMPGKWWMQGTKCIGDLAELNITCSRDLSRCELTSGWESRHYMEKSQLPVFEAQVNAGPATLTTEIILREP